MSTHFHDVKPGNKGKTDCMYFMLTWFLKLIELMADGCKVDMCRLKNCSI